MQPIEITPELLAELKERAEAATPGPWKVHTLEVQNPCSVLTRTASWIVLSDGENLPLADRKGVSNNRHIAAANPATVLALVAEIERLKQFEKPTCKHWWSEDHECWDSGCMEITGLHIGADSEPYDYCPNCGGVTEIVDEPETEREEER